jgi:hypothetical protein
MGVHIQGDTKKREHLINPTKIEEIQTCKTFLWRQHAVDRSTDPCLLNGEVCILRSLFRSAANCTWLLLRISKVSVFCVTLYYSLLAAILLKEQ